MRITVSILFMLTFFTTVAAGENACLSLSNGYSLDSLQISKVLPDEYLDALFERKLISPWKKRVLLSLWRKSARSNGGYSAIWEIYDLGAPAWVSMAFPGMSAVFTSAHPIIASALAKGLPAADRYVVIPAKVIATKVILKPITSLYVVLAVSGVNGFDKILGAIGITFPDPVLDETDPDSVGSDEVILVIGVSAPGENGAAALHQEAMSQLDGRVKTITIEPYKPWTLSDKLDQLRETLQNRGQKIKKIILASHGSPGNLHGIGTIENLVDIAITPLGPVLAKGVGIYLTGCNVAAREEDRKALIAMADKHLGKNGFIKANRTVGIAQSPFTAFLMNNAALYKMASYSRATFDSTTFEYNTGPLFGQPTTFEYTVP